MFAINLKQVCDEKLVENLEGNLQVYTAAQQQQAIFGSYNLSPPPSFFPCPFSYAVSFKPRPTQPQT